MRPGYVSRRNALTILRCALRQDLTPKQRRETHELIEDLELVEHNDELRREMHKPLGQRR